MAVAEPFQAVVVCGRNEELRDTMSGLTSVQAERFRVLDFTTEMADLMRDGHAVRREARWAVLL